MRQIGWLFMVVLGLAGLTLSQSSSDSTQSSKTMKLSGTVCRSSCLTQSSNLTTCDPVCTDKSGDAVLVDDSGNVTKIANPAICNSHMGKHVKATAVPASGSSAAAAAAPTEKQREEKVRIMELYDDPGGGF